MTQEEREILAWYNKSYGVNIAEEGWENEVYWPHISKNSTLSESFIAAHKYHVYWPYISQYQSLSESFIAANADFVNWSCISSYQNLSEDFISTHKGLVEWKFICQYQTLSEPFILKHGNLVHWKYISQCQILSENFIAANKDLVDWEYISARQILSEPFITAHKDLVHWPSISQYQFLSESFIAAHKDFVIWHYIPFHQTLSEEFFKKYAIQLGCAFEGVNRSTWLYASEKRKIEHIKGKASEFEVQEDEEGKFILAYKATCPGGKSSFFPSIRYEVGRIYEARCDHNMREDNSFGLSAWTEDEANNFIYGPYELYVVKIYIRDIGAMVHDGAKIRCKKQTFVERIK